MRKLHQFSYLKNKTTFVNILCVDNSGTQDDLSNKLASFFNNLDELYLFYRIGLYELETGYHNKDKNMYNLSIESSSGTALQKQITFQNVVDKCINVKHVCNNHIIFSDIKNFIFPFKENACESIKNFEDMSSLLSLAD